MVKLKQITSLDFKRYFYLVFFSNLLALFFLNDTTSFNLGLLSVQSFFYSINNLLFVFFILFETIAAYLDYYGLTFYFIELILTDITNLNTEFNIYIFFENFKYVIFFILNIAALFFRKTLFKLYFLIFKNKKLLSYLFLFLLTFILLIAYKVKDSNNFKVIYERSINKIHFIINGNFFRNDNWYNVSKNTIRYNKNNNKFSNFSFEKVLENHNEFQNIFVIINESYPNFKDLDLKKKLSYALESNLPNTKILKYKKDWGRYSTQGAEKNFFCDKKGTFNEFKLHLNNFLTKNNCWINSLRYRHNIFIHSFDKSMFRRNRYYSEDNAFFNEFYFKEELLNLDYNLCDTNRHYVGICENEIINNLLYKVKNNHKKKLIIYLTVENHIPVNIKYYKETICQNYPLNLHPQFCTLFHAQLNFNKEINKFIHNLESNDLLVFFSDTPPLLAQRDRIHFEDHIDVLIFKKKF